MLQDFITVNAIPLAFFFPYCPLRMTKNHAIVPKTCRMFNLIIKYFQQVFEDVKKCSESLHHLCLTLSIEKKTV